VMTTWACGGAGVTARHGGGAIRSQPGAGPSVHATNFAPRCSHCASSTRTRRVNQTDRDAGAGWDGQARQRRWRRQREADAIEEHQGEGSGKERALARAEMRHMRAVEQRDGLSIYRTRGESG
jgi:hypothetical protein